MKNTLLLFLLILAFTSQAQVSDIDGNSYDTVRIGTQTWMAENLNVSRFRNGDTIPEAKTDEEWEEAGDNGRPVWCYYDNEAENGPKCGKLYNWYALNDSRGLAPNGWHVVDDKEWMLVTEYLGGLKVAGAKMKGIDSWNYNEGKSGNGTNESGFSGFPYGYRGFAGTFYGTGLIGYWWSMTEFNVENARLMLLKHTHDEVYRFDNYKGSGLSVRCIKD